MKKHAVLAVAVFVALLLALPGMASAALDEMWAGGYIEVDIDDNVLADTFVTIHNPNRKRGMILRDLVVECYDEGGHLVGEPIILGKLLRKNAVTVNISSFIPPLFPPIWWQPPWHGKLFLRFYWLRPRLINYPYYWYRPWLEIKQVVWTNYWYPYGYWWLNPGFWPVLRPSYVRTWTEAVVHFNPWYHYYIDWPYYYAP
jgi:hypothetical protein